MEIDEPLNFGDDDNPEFITTPKVFTPPAPELPNLQGWPVLRVWKGAVYLRIPRELQRSTDGCSCNYCKAHPNETPSWDTLGVPLTGERRTTWTLHAPEWTSNDKIKKEDR